MKKLLLVAIAAVALYSCQKPMKIGFVDNTELVNEYQEKKDLEAVFKARVDAFNKKKDSLQQMFNLEYKQAQEMAAKASQKKQQELSMQIQQLGERLDQQISIEQKSISDDSKVQNDTILSTIKRFVKNHGIANDYDFIFGKNEITGNLYHGKEAHDITKAVLKELNDDYASKKK
ncbi:MAG: OmpH family outer membrane protein [Bacteroidota bacterium]